MSRIRVESDGAVARITLAQSEKGNTLDHETTHELLQAFTSCAQHTGTRVVVLTAEGEDFCASADPAIPADMTDATPEDRFAKAEAVGRLFTTMREMPKPVIAAVRGRALAAGAALATAADIVLAHQDAQFGFPEVLVGSVPAMAMAMLRRSVGEKRAYELVATGRRVGAVEAMEMGLVSRVLGADEFDDRVAAFAREIADSSMAAISLAKGLFYQLDGLDFRTRMLAAARASVSVRGSRDLRVGADSLVQVG